MLVVILADPPVLAVVLKQPVAILADQQVAVHLAVALKQLVVQHRVTAVVV